MTYLSSVLHLSQLLSWQNASKKDVSAIVISLLHTAEISRLSHIITELITDKCLLYNQGKFSWEIQFVETKTYDTAYDYSCLTQALENYGFMLNIQGKLKNYATRLKEKNNVYKKDTDT